MNKAKSNIIFLTGGLGNQLFQLGYGLSATKGKLFLETVNGRPRVSNFNHADILDFKLPGRIQSLKPRYSKFISKILSYNLRIEIVPTKLESLEWVKKLVRVASIPFISFHYNRLLKVLACRGVGFDNKTPKLTKNKVMVGYFQSFNWLSSETRTELRSISVSNPSKSFLELLELIKTEPTYIVHVRLGDYLQDSNFGTPSTAYFKNALAELRNLRGDARVWGFSDEPEKAKKILEKAGVSGIFWVPPLNLSSAETLQVMREGSGFAIANSTFSWWAAMLRHDESAPVIAPQPWFSGMDEPELLIPSGWLRMQAF